MSDTSAGKWVACSCCKRDDEIAYYKGHPVMPTVERYLGSGSFGAVDRAVIKAAAVLGWDAAMASSGGGIHECSPLMGLAAREWKRGRDSRATQPQANT